MRLTNTLNTFSLISKDYGNHRIYLMLVKRKPHRILAKSQGSFHQCEVQWVNGQWVGLCLELSRFNLGWGTALCPWARHFNLKVSLSTQVNKWVPANLLLGVALGWTSIPSRGGEIFLVAF